ncbi:MAG TPA: hypothetical protein VH988_14630 [Thermoanaerobaculia bacterium]|nr:hypothetical protein [Thermoanaerobaculia bacterium]
MRHSWSLRWLAAVALAFLLASPLAAYTIYLKNGQTIQAKGKYRLDKGKAYITLSNGQQTFLNASEIDIAKTDAENKSDYGGNAVILDQGTPGKNQVTPPPPDKKLSELIANKEAARELPGRRDKPVDTAKPATRTRAGFSDLTTLGRRPFPQTDVLTELQQFFHGQGVDEVEVFAGTQGDRPLIEVTATSEGAVFRGLVVGANALLHIRDRFPNKVGALELLLLTPTRERGGQFVLTPDLASDLVAKKVEPQAFFVEHVQF